MKYIITILLTAFLSACTADTNIQQELPRHDTVEPEINYDTIPPIKPRDSALAHDAVAYNLVGVISTDEGDTLELINEKGDYIKVSVIRHRPVSQPGLYKQVKWLEEDSITISKKYLFNRVMMYHDAGWHQGYFARLEEKHGSRTHQQIKTADSLIAVKYLENTFK